MAVAARPGPSDARVPCPLCGGLIHPIAGRCKHCKADLTTYHAARPAANAPLPALFRAPAAHAGHDARPAHAVEPTVAHAPIAGARDAAQPVLPPRPTAAGHAVPSASGWRSWPILVIIVATLAIVVAALLMVWPARAARDGKRSGQPPPAPERMDTQNPGESAAPPTRQPRPAPVTPPQGAPPQGARPDPWGQAPPPAVVPDPSDADADADADHDSLADPFAAPSRLPTPRGRRKLALNGRGLVTFAMADHLCRKMVQCGNDDPAIARACDSMSSGAADLPTNCPAAARCLQHIDAMACSSRGDDLARLGQLMTQFRDCADAARC